MTDEENCDHSCDYPDFLLYARRLRRSGEPINYTKSEFDQGAASSDITLTVPSRPVQTGEQITATVRISARRALPEGKEAVYYVVDWGDGTWSYQGPGLHSATEQSRPSLPHTYKRAGQYTVRATAYSMQQTEEIFGWSEGKTIDVTGEDHEPQGMLKTLSVTSSKSYSDSTSAENIMDGKPTYFCSAAAQEPDEELYVGYLFDTIYTLDLLEVKIPAACTLFPSNVAVEYTTDGGQSWQSLPKYYYLYQYSVGRFTPIMNFPNPKGATLSLPLDGVVANGIRFVSKLTSTRLEDLGKEKTLEVEEMRVYGSPRTLLYTSMGDTYDADLNNMWSIFGTAKTEPQVLGSLLGEQQNTSPFRTGSGMIGSTEWVEWTGMKFNFTDYSAIKELYLDQLCNVRTGPDGWSQDDGYVWATANSPYHLNETFGAHYSLNPIFVLAVRNYLLQCNELGRYADDMSFTEFMKLRNGVGQTMEEKLDKAMSYMMNTLDGKSGIMTIFDPAHDGTSSGMSSNYWDDHRAFGYRSAYENALFYGALQAYADISEYLALHTADGKLAESYSARANEYRAYAAETKKQYNRLFWDNAKGRFIGGVNIDGERIDFGYTYVNFMALAYGVADEDKAVDIYDWLDGKRIVEGDTSTGEDIYGHFKYAARSNTLDVSSVKDADNAYYWYDHGGVLPCTPGSFGGYGNQMQNGGTIFYISYYDLMGRLKLGADNAAARFNTIMEEFHKDSLRRNSYSIHGEYIEGVIGEFPESGLVPYFFINGFLGISTTAQGLRICPQLPSDMEYAGVAEYHFGNREYSIQVGKNISAPAVHKYEKPDGSTLWYVQLPADKTYLITADNRLIEQ